MGVITQCHGSPARGLRVRADCGGDETCDSALSAGGGPVVLGDGVGATGALGTGFGVVQDAEGACNRRQAGAGAAGKPQRQGEGTDSRETRVVHGNAPWSWKGKGRYT